MEGPEDEISEVLQQEETYELAVMRAELLGLPVPDRIAFEASRAKRQANDDDEDLQALRDQEETEQQDAAGLQEANHQQEELRGVAGGFEELTNILSITQTKLNRFKTVCGSIKNLFKLRDGEGGGQSDGETSDAEGHAAPPTSSAGMGEQPSVDGEAAAAGVQQSSTGVRSAAKDMNQTLGSQVDKLDSLLMKAEHASMSMQAQNKQMRGFLR